MLKCTRCRKGLQEGQDIHWVSVDGMEMGHHVFCRTFLFFTWNFEWPTRGACHQFMSSNGKKYWLHNMQGVLQGYET